MAPGSETACESIVVGHASGSAYEDVMAPGSETACESIVVGHASGSA